jgi:isoamylase
MILHGDEMGRSQRGNNNVYCQDNELSWVDWDLQPWQKELLGFTRRMVALRREHPVFRRRRFFAGAAAMGGQSDVGDIAWFNPGGTPMTMQDWQNWNARAVMVFLNGERVLAPDPRGRKVVDDSFLVLFNAHHEDMTFTLPARRFGAEWVHEICTFEPRLEPGAQRWPSRGQVAVHARSMKLLRRA